MIINDCAVTKELLDSEEFANGSIELRIHKFEGALTLSPVVKHKDEVLCGVTGTRFEPVDCSELEVMGKFKTRHIKGSAKCLLKLFNTDIRPF
jgi:hypothetical protein